MDKYSKQFFVEAGRRGGRKTFEKWGKKYLLALAQKGGKAPKKKKNTPVHKSPIDK